MDKLVVEALSFAAHKHRYQIRHYKDAPSEPYLHHPIQLLHILAIEAGINDPEVLAAALLHDTVEDTETSFEELEENFGKKVTDIVRELTDDKTLPKALRKELQIEHAAHVSYKAKLVKLADKIANVRDTTQGNTPPQWTVERTQEYRRWATKVVDQLRRTHQVLEDLFDAIP